MAPRVRLTLMGVAMMALIGAVVAVLAINPSPAPRQSPSAQLEGAISPAGMPPTDFRLRDQDGRPVSISSFRGGPVVVTFLYTTCQDTCPVMTQQIKGALDKLGHDVPVLGVSVDPANDTENNARRFLLKEGMTGRMQILLGSRAALEPVWRTFGIRPQEDGRDHSSRVVVLDGAGRQRVAWPASELTPEGLAHDLRALSRSSVTPS